jgi:hypothetical protein
MLKKLLFPAAFFIAATCTSLYAQDDLLALVADSTMPDPGKSPVYATFKTTKIINAQSIETVKKRTMDFRITHRFGNIGGESGGGGHTMWGFDQSDDIRFSFDFGITDKLQVGVGRSKWNELLDGSVKWRFLEQTVNNKIPLSVCVYSSIGISPQSRAAFYPSNVIIPNLPDDPKKVFFAHRINYFSEIIIARKFGDRFSIELMPAYHHRNFVVENTNSANGAKETNDLIVFGIGGRIKITKRIAFIADYHYIMSDFRKNNPGFENPLGVGVEIETGGHVFHLTFTNAAGILENNFIPSTTDKWKDGGIKFGFNISRVFNL